MDMMENKDHIVEKKVYEEGKKEYASKGVANAGLTLGIIGTALGALPWLANNRSGGIFGSLGGNMPDNININSYGGMTGGNVAPTALEVMEKECSDEVRLLTDMFGLKLDTANKFYAMRDTDINEKFSLWKGLNDSINAETRRSMEAEFGLYKNNRDMYDNMKDTVVQQGFSLYKGQRDSFDALNEKYAAKFNELDKEVAVLKAIRPYQDRLLMDYTDKKCCRKIDGVLGLQSTPTVTILPSASVCGCVNSTTPSTGA